MGLRRTRQASWSGRLLRGWRPDRNPLRRGSDRAETTILGALVALFLVGTPLIWHFAGSWSYAAYSREARAQRAVLHQVPATLLQAVPGWNVSGSEGADVIARWQAPDGGLRTGPVFVPDGVASGTVLVWTDQAGQLTDPPLQQAQVAVRARLAGMMAVIALAVTLFGAGALARRVLDRRRLAAWETDWLATGPRWSPRR